MAGFGKRKRVRRTVDLTSGGRFAGRRPSERGLARDIEPLAGRRAHRRISTLIRRGQKHLAEVSRVAGYRWGVGVTGASLLAALVASTLAGAPPAVAALICLGALTVVGAGAVAVVRAAGKARRRSAGQGMSHRKRRRGERAAARHPGRRRRRKGGRGRKAPRGRRS